MICSKAHHGLLWKPWAARFLRRMSCSHVQYGLLEVVSSLVVKRFEEATASWIAIAYSDAQCGLLETFSSAFLRRFEEPAAFSNAMAMIRPHAHCGILDATSGSLPKRFDEEPASRNATVDCHFYRGQLVAENGLLEDSRSVYRSSLERDDGVVPFNVRISEYARNGRLEDARRLFDSTEQRDVVSWNTIIFSYAANGYLIEAKSLFDRMPTRDVVSWNSMITGCARNGEGEEALNFFLRMELEGPKPSKVTFIGALDVCASLGDLKWGRRLHAWIVCGGADLDTVVATALVDMYGKCGSVGPAGRVFEGMVTTQRSVVTWNAMIGAYGQTEDALSLLWRMDKEGVEPDRVTFVSALGACKSAADGKMVHARIARSGLDTNTDVVVGSTLVSMYGKCGCLDTAWRVFELIPRPSVVSWNSIISAYAAQAQGSCALALFRCMPHLGTKPNRITFAAILDACASLGRSDLNLGKMFHASVVDSGSHSDALAGAALIRMYTKCVKTKDSRGVFNRISCGGGDVICWNAMITGYVRNGQDEEALQLFWRMGRECAKPDKITFSSIIDACASLAILDQGKLVHGGIASQGSELDVVLWTALINMYGKCGSPKDARRAFDAMPCRDTIAWTAVISSYALNGYGKMALELLAHMSLLGKKPDNVTFVSILSACGHAGLVDEGWRCFNSMAREHGIAPTGQHYCCMVDLLTRAGRLDAAEKLVKDMPSDILGEARVVAWTSLLDACRTHGDDLRGERIEKLLCEKDRKSIAPIVLLSETCIVHEGP